METSVLQTNEINLRFSAEMRLRKLWYTFRLGLWIIRIVKILIRLLFWY